MAGLTEAQIFKEVCENDFSFFAKQYLKVVEPETKFEWNWHMDALCHYCERVYYGDYQNLDINIPPRMSKSLIVSVLFPAWVWAKKPSSKFLCASMNFDLATKFNSRRRDLIQSEEYKCIWPVILREDKNTAQLFFNYQNGFMRSVSAGGKITGDGGDFLISDDLLDAMDSFSKSERDSVNKWFSNAFYNRAQNKKLVKRININQRLHSEDPSGHLKTNHSFHTLILPMIMTDKPPKSTVDFVDPRAPGEFLFPARYGQPEMDDDYKSLGLYGWSSQYQQDPRPIGGGIIKEEWIKYYSSGELPERFDRTIITADLKFKGKETADYVSFMYWGIKGPKKYLINFARGKWTYKITKDMFIKFCDSNPATLKYIEDKANGPALISDFDTTISGLKPWPEKGSKYMNIDKVTRVRLVSSDFEIGDVYFPKDHALTEKLVEELTSMTENGSSGTDDMVDTTTMALIQFKKSETFFFG